MKKVKKRRMRYRVEYAFLRSKKTPQTEELDSRNKTTEWVQSRVHSNVLLV